MSQDIWGKEAAELEEVKGSLHYTRAGKGHYQQIIKDFEDGEDAERWKKVLAAVWEDLKPQIKEIDIGAKDIQVTIDQAVKDQTASVQQNPPKRAPKKIIDEDGSLIKGNKERWSALHTRDRTKERTNNWMSYKCEIREERTVYHQYRSQT